MEAGSFRQSVGSKRGVDAEVRVRGSRTQYLHDTRPRDTLNNHGGHSCRLGCFNVAGVLELAAAAAANFSLVPKLCGWFSFETPMRSRSFPFWTLEPGCGDDKACWIRGWAAESSGCCGRTRRCHGRGFAPRGEAADVVRLIGCGMVREEEPGTGCACNV